MRHSSDLLKSAYSGDLTTLRQLVSFAGLTPEQAADLCCVSPHTFRRWLSDRKPNPTAVRLLAIHCGYLPWQGWKGWEMDNGYLFPPGYSRHGLAPGDILAVPFLHQLILEYRRMVDLTKPDQDQVGENQSAEIHNLVKKPQGL